MKYIFLALSSLFIIQSCAPNKSNDAIVAGRIDNPTDSIICFFYGEEKDTAALNEAGEFNIRFDIQTPTKVTFKYGHEHSSFLLMKGSDMYLTLDPEEFDETIKYIGVGSEINNFLAGDVLTKEKNRANKGREYGYPVDSFKQYVNEYAHARFTSLKTFTEGVKGIDSLVEAEHKKIQYERFNAFVAYPDMYFMLHEDSVDLGKSYYDFLKDLNRNDNDFAEFRVYLNLLYTLAQTEVKGDKDLMYEYFKTNHTGKVQEQLLYKYVARELDTDPFAKGIDALVEMYLKDQTDTALANKIDKANKVWKTLAPGQPAPEIAYPNLQGDTVRLSDLKGKLVYVDVWATWCGPCMRETPHLKDLITKYEGKDVSFLQVSVDNSVAAWERVIKEKDTGAIQLCAGGWKKELAKAYNIRYIPRFMLIDQEGMIIDVDAARPSSEAVYELIDSNM